MESSSNHKECLLKIEDSMSGWDKSLERLLKTINDLSFRIDKQSKTVYVSGKIDPQKILEKIIKAGKKAVIIWGEDGRNKQPKNQKDDLMEQCYAPPPHGFSNDPYNHCSYPPPPNYWMNPPQRYHHSFAPPPPNCWMNPPQPYHHSLAPPPPYVRQFHPQPSAPPPYEFHQTEPVPKSFPPTPAPPKNFVMGDLQLCRIM